MEETVFDPQLAERVVIEDADKDVPAVEVVVDVGHMNLCWCSKMSIHEIVCGDMSTREVARKHHDPAHCRAPYSRDA